MDPFPRMAVNCTRCKTKLQYPPGQQRIKCGVCGQIFAIGPPISNAPQHVQSYATQYPQSHAPQYPPSYAPQYPPSYAPQYPPSYESQYPPSQVPQYPPSHAPQYPQSYAPPHQQQQARQHAPHYTPVPPTTGRRRAMIVGINYENTRSQLRGCINDAECMEYMLKSRFHFTQDNILKMTDTSPDPRLWPTHANMLGGFQWLVNGAQPGDTLVFHFSGHGSQKRSRTEADGFDETLLPCDFETHGQIVDDTINECLVRPLREGVKLLAIIDACHSGTVLDIQYQYCGKDHRGQPHWKDHTFGNIYQGTSGGLAISISGCDDGEQASDTKRLSGTVATGAMTYAFIQAIESGQTHTWDSLIAAMRETVRSSQRPRPGSAQGGILSMLMNAGFAQSLGPSRQEPQLSASAIIDTNSPFQL